MLLPARDAGFEVVGNVEDRTLFYRQEFGDTTFSRNFPEAWMSKTLPDSLPPIDLVVGHPSCGKFSIMNYVTSNHKVSSKEEGSIRPFIDYVAKVRPRFFLMDNLERSFLGFSAQAYAISLPEYDIFFEPVSHYHYGNPQRTRTRVMVIGALKNENFIFVPGATMAKHRTTRDCIEDLLGREGKVQGHFPHVLDVISRKSKGMAEQGEKMTWRVFNEWLKGLGEGKTFTYTAACGATKRKLGSSKNKWDGPSRTIIGAGCNINPITNWPLTPRERARIMGFPDSFEFLGFIREPDGSWNYDLNGYGLKQIGKGVPLEFTRYACLQIAAHLMDLPFDGASGKRYGKIRPEVEFAQKWYCANIGYARQNEVCGLCSYYGDCENRQLKLELED
jgi:DNA (cytosine-5)-methyltransferase 1